MKKIWVCASIFRQFGGGEGRAFAIFQEPEEIHISFNKLTEVVEYLQEQRGELGLTEVQIKLEKPCDVALIPYCTFPVVYDELTGEEKKQILQHLFGSSIAAYIQIANAWHK